MITVKETDIETILKVHPNIVEFDDPNAPASFFLSKYTRIINILLLLLILIKNQLDI